MLKGNSGRGGAHLGARRARAEQRVFLLGGAGTVVKAARRLPPLLGSRRWRGRVSPAASPQGSRRWIDLLHRCQRCLPREICRPSPLPAGRCRFLGCTGVSARQMGHRGRGWWHYQW
ncbi:hypothetical protein NDU88_002682 [Pleurodeles waltl]|uniref:Uncharacterized protein n=1 Tax=Pleurodeles waltl TaxID=8319 RepID=A0AAV7WQY6_PLEWA|nr:hypothetical protein NDU88_002682 [Pleurodeles waltl]